MGASSGERGRCRSYQLGEPRNAFIEGVEKIIALGKPVIWTMHDMWCMTGICHHAGDCRGYLKKCGNCPLLGKRGGDNDLSHKIWEKEAPRVA